MSQRLFNLCHTLPMGMHKNKRELLFLNFLFITLLLCISFNVKAQGDDSIDFHNIHIDFSQTLGEGVTGNGNFKILPINKELTEIQYKFEKRATPNPYSISYKYNLHNKEDGSFSMDLKSAVEPLELRIDESIETEFFGDMIDFPQKLEVGNSLPEAEGYCILKKKSGKMILMYNIKVTNRKIERIETMDINGENLDAFVISYDYLLEKSNPYDIVIQKSEHRVTDWIIPSLGIVKQDREGSSVSGMDSNSSGSIYQFSHKTNLNSIQKN